MVGGDITKGTSIYKNLITGKETNIVLLNNGKINEKIHPLKTLPRNQVREVAMCVNKMIDQFIKK